MEKEKVEQNYNYIQRVRDWERKQRTRTDREVKTARIDKQTKGKDKKNRKIIKCLPTGTKYMKSLKTTVDTRKEIK